MAENPFEKVKHKQKLDFKDLPPLQTEIQEICCPSCTSSIPADDLNIQTNIAKCTSCNIVFSFRDQIDNLVHHNHLTQEILKPEGVEIMHFNEEMDISVQQSWGVGEIIFLSSFPMILIMIIGMMAETMQSNPARQSIIFTLVISTVIAYISYFLLRKRHKIFINIDDDTLSIERRPKKFIADKRYDVKNIDQLYVKDVTTSKGLQGHGIFMIYNGVNGQKHIELVKSVNTRSKAKYIEQEIEKRLKIVNRRVPDES